MTAPTFSGMPEPLQTPDTPTEAPGTPNSTTTSLSTLSTTAFKDGHRGSSFPFPSQGHHRLSSNILEAERADRISRLAGLERVSALRGTGAGQMALGGQVAGYFDHNGNPVYMTKMSTVGSASATEGTEEQTTTWASGSFREDEDHMSEETIDDRERYSTPTMDDDHDHDRDGDGDGMSDNQSLVGFGEGAGSTVSGPIYVRGRGVLSQNQSGPGTPVHLDVDRQRRDARIVDALTDDSLGNCFTDTIRRAEGKEQAERIIRERIGSNSITLCQGSPDEGSRD
ncbi:BgTH12-02728 [Blumeria graminis f. sp. triticale]|uniref:Bgt-3103 n=3 Tax=Blumeria graminis TaxID=34373 RepID=A0A061HIU9_BLUGR|nr:hypothetical protein BGT96224_3103 [Blumeria graminis f. sp. tritici 96224]CAD6503057.1 BgTH12-02728 [Blumeria graminis f. sp. triticale]VDB88993.1 Bgt-3103 [Blumeria graminis f. sp. tritici]